VKHGKGLGLFFFFEWESLYSAQAGLELLGSSTPLRSQNHRCTPFLALNFVLNVKEGRPTGTKNTKFSLVIFLALNPNHRVTFKSRVEPSVQSHFILSLRGPKRNQCKVKAQI
jgi:hypothetical protein